MLNRLRAWRAKRVQGRLDRLAEQHATDRELQKNWSSKEKPVNTTGGGGGT
jgi:hypothetical protein